MEKLYKFEGEKMTRPQPLFRLPFGFSLGLIAVMLVSACAPATPLPGKSGRSFNAEK
jgi:hypothetical protein